MSEPSVENEKFPASRKKCEHCNGIGADFIYEGHNLCCECMSEFTSWLLDGGALVRPDQFAYMAVSHA